MKHQMQNYGDICNNFDCFLITRKQVHLCGHKYYRTWYLCLGHSSYRNDLYVPLNLKANLKQRNLMIYLFLGP